MKIEQEKGWEYPYPAVYRIDQFLSGTGEAAGIFGDGIDMLLCSQRDKVRVISRRELNR
ncbi:MAG: hypothetical protein HFG59_00065 [Lachnospiraceae bacterium]|nr:hypothetical protein [Lachnospiraceae bacterium]